MAKAPTKKDDKEPPGGEVKPPRSRRKLFLIAGGGGFALAIAAAGGAFALGLVGGDHGPAKPMEAPRKAHFLDLPDMTVNLTGGEQTPAFLRIRIALEVGDKAVADLIQPVMPRVLDAFQTYLRELRPSDLSGSAGVYRLKEELRRRVNLAVHPAKVDAVLFKEILIQ